MVWKTNLFLTSPVTAVQNTEVFQENLSLKDCQKIYYLRITYIFI